MYQQVVCEKPDYRFKLNDGNDVLTFNGFRLADEPSDDESLVVAWVDGGYENWFLEPGNSTALDNLITYYEAMGFAGVQYRVYDPRRT